MKLGTAFVEIRPDTKAFARDLEQQTTQSASQVGKNLAGALAGGAFLAGAKKAVDAASDLNEAVNVTNITFGAAEKQVSDFAKTAAESIGQSERAARQATATFGGLLLNLGLTEEEAASTSITLTKLASDLGSAFNTDPADAALALSSALRGEQEPIMRYNVLLSDQAVRQKAVAMNLAATTAAVDENGKVQARLQLIMEQTSRVQGDFANTADGAANAQRTAAAKAEDAAADMGENVLPIYEKLVQTVGFVADAFGSLPEPVQTALIVLGGIAALTGPVKIAAESIGLLATITRTALSKGLDMAAIGAYNLTGNLGKVALGAGALGAAFYGASVILDSYQKSKAKAAELEAEFTRLLEEQSEAVGGNTRAFAGSEILKGELGQALRDAGANVSRFTAGIVDSNDELSHLTGKTLADVKTGMTDLGDVLNTLDAGPLRDELIKLAESGELSDEQMIELISRLQVLEQSYINAGREGKNKAEADEEAGAAAKTAAPKVEDLSDKLTINEQAARDAAESVDLFREAVEKALQPLDLEAAVDDRTQALDDMAQAIEDRAQAVADARRRIDELQDIKKEDRPEDFARQMEEAQADLREALDLTSLSLQGNSDAALRNRDDLRELINASVDIIETARDQGKSLEDLQGIRRLEIDLLREQLREMGYSKAEIERYIDRIEEIPLTRATTITVETAAAIEAMERLIDQYERLPGDLRVEAQLQRKSATTAHAAGGHVFDGDFLVGDAGVPELLRKRGNDVEVIAGGMPMPVSSGGAMSDALVALMAEQNALLMQIAGNTAGPTTTTRLRRVQTMAGVI